MICERTLQSIPFGNIRCLFVPSRKVLSYYFQDLIFQTQTQTLQIIIFFDLEAWNFCGDGLLSCLRPQSLAGEGMSKHHRTAQNSPAGQDMENRTSMHRPTVDERSVYRYPTPRSGGSRSKGSRLFCDLSYSCPAGQGFRPSGWWLRYSSTNQVVHESSVCLLLRIMKRPLTTSLDNLYLYYLLIDRESSTQTENEV